MIISIHVPKTAGASFCNSLQRAFGQRLLQTYETRPLSSHPVDRWARMKCRFRVLLNGRKIVANHDVIHGHFDADIYARLPGAKQYCIFLRNPVDRVISHFVYWNAQKASPARQRHTLWEHMIRNQLEVLDFARLPLMVNFYSFFLGRKMIEEFDFVGLTEEYSTSLNLFHKIFGIHLEETRINTADLEYRSELLSSRPDYAQLRLTQEKNQEIYDRARHRFDQLCRQFL